MKITVPTIDFGTSKIVTLVAENSSATRCDIVGAGIVPYSGYARDGWNDLHEIDDAIRESVAQAEKTSRRRLRELNVGVPGMFTRVQVTEVKVALSGPDPHVTAADVRACFKLAREQVGDSYPVMHSSPAWFKVDDGKKTLQPVGIKGRELSALISFVTVDSFFVNDVSARLQKMGIEMKSFYSTVAGEAMLYLPLEERDKTAVLLDIGYLNTDVCVVEGDALIFYKCLETGAGYITVDLAEQLNIPFKAAEEKVKQVYSFGSGLTDETYTIPATADTPARTLTREEVSPIINARVTQIAEEIQQALEDGGIKLGSRSNIYLTGGGLTFNKGGRDFLSGKLRRPVRETPRLTVKMTSHIYSSAMGLIDLIVTTMEEQRQPDAGASSVIKNVFKWLLGGS